MSTFSKEVREKALQASYGYCQCSPACHEKVTEFHHMLPNTKVNQNLYPLFLQSIFNCCPISHGCHMNKPKRKVREADAAVFEWYLQDLVSKKF